MNACLAVRVDEMGEEELHFLCRTGEVPVRGVLAVEAPGYEPLAVCRVGGQYYLIADTCTHGQASLSEGEIIDGQVCCPYHGGTFDPETGDATGPPCTVPVKTYRLIQHGDRLLVARRRDERAGAGGGVGACTGD